MQNVAGCESAATARPRSRAASLGHDGVGVSYSCSCPAACVVVSLRLGRLQTHRLASHRVPRQSQSWYAALMSADEEQSSLAMAALLPFQRQVSGINVL